MDDILAEETSSVGLEGEALAPRLAIPLHTPPSACHGLLFQRLMINIPVPKLDMTCQSLILIQVGDLKVTCRSRDAANLLLLLLHHIYSPVYSKPSPDATHRHQSVQQQRLVEQSRPQLCRLLSHRIVSPPCLILSNTTKEARDRGGVASQKCPSPRPASRTLRLVASRAEPLLRGGFRDL